jgi:outer membrane immunogenic protein
MRKLALLLGGLAFSSPVFAADMAVKAPPLPPLAAPGYSWTGFYIGGNAGYGWKDPAVNLIPNDFAAQVVTCLTPADGCPPPVSFNIHGALGGVQAGYNYQVTQNWLIGFETDFDWSNIRGTGTSNFILGGFPSSWQASESVKWFGTIRARVGYVLISKLLLFATGGFAYGRVDENAAINSTVSGAAAGGNGFECTNVGGAGATNCFVGNSSRTATGFAVGGGGEYALGNNVSLKVEYLYVNLGHADHVNVVAQVPAPLTAPASFTAAYSALDFSVVRGGLNWRF